MGYEQFLSDLELKIPMTGVLALSIELKKDLESRYKTNNKERVIKNTNDAIEYLIEYFGDLYQSNDMTKVDEFENYDPPKDEELYDIKFEGDRVQILINADDVLIICHKYSWHGGNINDNKFQIMSKYSSPFKLLMGFEGDVYQLYCYEGKMIKKVLVDENKDVGKLSHGEWLEMVFINNHNNVRAAMHYDK